MLAIFDIVNVRIRGHWSCGEWVIVRCRLYVGLGCPGVGQRWSVSPLCIEEKWSVLLRGIDTGGFLKDARVECYMEHAYQVRAAVDA